MIKNLISIYKNILAFSIVVIISMSLIHHLAPIHLVLLFQCITIVILSLMYRTIVLFIMNHIIKDLPENIKNLVLNKKHSFSIKLFSKKIFYNGPNFLNALIAHLKNAYSEHELLHKEYDILNNNLEYNIKIKDFLLDINHTIYNFENQLDFLNYLLDKTIQTIPNATHGSVLKIIENDRLEFIAAYGYDLSSLQKININLKEATLYIKSNGEMNNTCIINNINEFNFHNMDESKHDLIKEINNFSASTTVTSPIYVNNKLFGVLNIDSSKSNAFEEEIIPIMDYVSNQISIVLENFITFKETVNLSKYDKFTGIYNRSYFEEVLQNYRKKALRYEEEFVLIMIDLDNLKCINDTYGHTAGDFAIKEFVSFTKDGIRESDIFARYGGDEFVVIFFNSPEEEVQNKFKHIQNELNKNKHLFNNTLIDISFSFGTSVFPRDSVLLNVLIKYADENMYLNKSNKKRMP